MPQRWIWALPGRADLLDETFGAGSNFGKMAMFRGAVLFLVVSAALHAETSKLWGEKGELWSPQSRLPDFSFAGYHFGEESPPAVPPSSSVKDFGAKGDGKSDDTVAFQQAVKEAAGKVILVPKGVYLLSDRVSIRGKGTVLRGEQRDASTLVFTKGLEQIDPRSAVNDGGQPTSAWSWGGGLLSIESGRSGSGARLALSGGPLRGDMAIAVAGPAKLAAQDFLLIEWKDSPDGAFTRYLYRDDVGSASGLFGTSSCRQLVQILKIEGNKLLLNRPLRCDIRDEFGCTAIKFDPETSECGIENLTLQFQSSDYLGHFQELGFNAIAVSKDAAHCWVRDLRIVDADSGIFGVGMHGTADRILFEAKRGPAREGMTGHHGVDGGIDCLIQNVTFDTKFFHDLSVSGGYAGNVFRLVRGLDVNLDHHRWGPYENLFTSLDLGAGTRVWVSGGGGNRGKHSAAGATFWNLKTKANMELPGEDFGPPQMNFVGLKIRGRESREPDSRWVERGSVVPPDLYQAQLEKRLAEGRGVYRGAPAATGKELAEWTTAQGKPVMARFGGLQGQKVLLITPDGRQHAVPLTALSPESRARAAKLGAK